MEETHELTSTDMYSPRIAYDVYASSKKDSSLLSQDSVVLAGSGAVIIFIFLMIYVFLRNTRASSAERKRNILSVIPDKKSEAQSKPEYFQLSICVEGPASTDDSVLSSLAARVVREAENLYIPGVNRRDSADEAFAWSVQTQFPSDKLCGTRLFPSAGWFERPDIIERPVKCLCVCLQYTAETSPATLYSLVDEAGRQVEKSYLKGGHYHGSEGYTFCMSQF